MKRILYLLAAMLLFNCVSENTTPLIPEDDHLSHANKTKLESKAKAMLNQAIPEYEDGFNFLFGYDSCFVSPDWNNFRIEQHNDSITIVSVGYNTMRTDITPRLYICHNKDGLFAFLRMSNKRYYSNNIEEKGISEYIVYDIGEQESVLRKYVLEDDKFVEEQALKLSTKTQEELNSKIFSETFETRAMDEAGDDWIIEIPELIVKPKPRPGNPLDGFGSFGPGKYGCDHAMDLIGDGSSGGYHGGGGGGPTPKQPDTKQKKEPVLDPCANIANKNNSQSYKDMHSKLENKLGGKREYGNYYTYDNGEYKPGPELTGPEGKHELDHFTLPYPIDGFIHTHFSGGGRCFSISDLFMIFAWYHEGNIKNINSFTMTLITSDGEAIMHITDSTMFKNYCKDLPANYEVIDRRRHNEDIIFMNTVEGFGTKDFSRTNKEFAKTLKNMKCGISLTVKGKKDKKYKKYKVLGDKTSNYEVIRSSCSDK